MVRSYVAIGDEVTNGQIVASVDGQAVPAGLDGVLRGMLHPGLWVVTGTKLGDVNPPRRAYTLFLLLR